METVKNFSLCSKSTSSYKQKHLSKCLVGHAWNCSVHALYTDGVSELRGRWILQKLLGQFSLSFLRLAKVTSQTYGKGMKQ